MPPPMITTFDWLGSSRRPAMESFDVDGADEDRQRVEDREPFTKETFLPRSRWTLFTKWRASFGKPARWALCSNIMGAQCNATLWSHANCRTSPQVVYPLEREKRQINASLKPTSIGIETVEESYNQRTGKNKQTNKQTKQKTLCHALLAVSLCVGGFRCPYSWPWQCQCECDQCESYCQRQCQCQYYLASLPMRVNYNNCTFLAEIQNDKTRKLAS